EDLQRAYMQLAAGQPVSLPRKTTAFIHWARALADYAREADLAEDLAFWREIDRMPNPRLPLRSENGDQDNIEALAATVSLSLDAEATQTLLQGLPEVFGSDMQTGLLAALAWALRAWTGEARLKLAMEGHGRDLALPGMDITRTVGWFTTLFPVALDIRDAIEIPAVLARVQEQLGQASARAVSYGLLRYLRGEAGLAGEMPLISFNYLGQFQGEEGGGFRPAVEDQGPERHPHNHRPHMLDFTASIVDSTLLLRVSYPDHRLTEQAIRALITLWSDALTSLVETMESAGLIADASSVMDEEDFDDLLAELEL
ncbi:MAG TPA: hypothetical protein ENK60_01180, partial [Anaerolineae bacterium]|nr:hypothetical protein [Anaerolineae bacterium]